jgi:hypothetical protein
LVGSAASNGRVVLDKIEEKQASPQNIYRSFERMHVVLVLLFETKRICKAIPQLRREANRIQLHGYSIIALSITISLAIILA